MCRHSCDSPCSTRRLAELAGLAHLAAIAVPDGRVHVWTEAAPALASFVPGHQAAHHACQHPRAPTSAEWHQRAVQQLAHHTRPDGRATRYDGGPVIAAEIARDAERARTLDSLRTRYLRQPVLRIVPSAMQATFDPTGQRPLDDLGTGMNTFRWASSDGAELSAPAGALVSPTWSHAQAPLGDASLSEGVIPDPIEISGSGWRLKLPRDWVVTRRGSATEVRPPSPYCADRRCANGVQEWSSTRRSCARPQQKQTHAA